MKRNKAKNEFLSLCTKYRALMHVERDCPETLTREDQARAASNHIGQVISSRTWKNQQKAKESIIEQVDSEDGPAKRRSKFKRTKTLIKPEQKKFETEVGVCLVKLFQTRNLTIENAMSEAKRIKQEKYPDLKFHRMPCSGYGRTYVLM